MSTSTLLSELEMGLAALQSNLSENALPHFRKAASFVDESFIQKYPRQAVAVYSGLLSCHHQQNNIDNHECELFRQLLISKSTDSLTRIRTDFLYAHQVLGNQEDVRVISFLENLFTDIFPADNEPGSVDSVIAMFENEDSNKSMSGLLATVLEYVSEIAPFLMLNEPSAGRAFVLRLFCFYGAGKKDIVDPLSMALLASALAGTDMYQEKAVKLGSRAITFSVDAAHRDRIILLWNVFVRPVLEPVRNSLPSVEIGYRTFLSENQYALANTAARCFAEFSFISGIGLAEINTSIKEFANFLQSYHNMGIARQLSPLYTLVNTLAGKGAMPDGTVTDSFEIEGAGFSWEFYTRIKMVFMRTTSGLVAEDSLRLSNPGNFTTVLHEQTNIFYSALLLAALSNTAIGEQRDNLLMQISGLVEQFRELASVSPINHAHHFQLLQAEYYRLTGNDGNAREHYDLAINLAHEHGYRHEEALANELAAEFYISKDKIPFARYHILEAKENYQLWGAAVKVQAIEDTYREIISVSTTYSGMATTPMDILQSLGERTLQITNSFLDMSSLIKASQSITGEFVLSNLLTTLMKILAENSGAQKGCLILGNDGRFFIEAETEGVYNRTSVLQSIALESAGSKLSVSMVNYVIRTKETVLLKPANIPHPYQYDTYFAEHAPQSVLCVPVVLRGKTLGALYLENNSMADGFSQERVDLLKILAVQAAMVIENARLYADLEARVRSRTEELAQSNLQLKAEIEERKKTQFALSEKEKDYRVIFDNVPACILYVDRTGNILRSNEYAKRLFNESTSLDGRQLNDLFVKSYGAELADNLENVCSKGEPVTGLVSEIGEVAATAQWIVTEMVPYFNEGGVIVGAIVMCVNITAQKLAEEDALRKNRALLESNITKDKFFSIIAHDMKSPFQGLIGFSQLLRLQYDFLSEDEKKHIIENMFELSMNSLKLVENLLDWARLQTGKMVFQPTSFLVDDELLATVEVMMQTARNKSVELQWTVPKDLRITADKNMINAIVRNLLSNAVKFTPSGGKVTLTTVENAREIAIAVTDTGVGMEAHILKRLFSLTDNYHTSGTNNESGTGLGLLLCREMAEKHGGRIEVSSRKGTGSTFTLVLPK